MLFHKKAKTTNRTEPNQKMYMRSETQLCDTIKRYLVNIEADKFCSRGHKVAHINRMYTHMLSPNSKNILIRPRFANFRVMLMNKCEELRQEAENHKSSLGLWGLGIETYNEYNKLIEKLISMMMFLEDNGEPTPYANSKSPTKPVSTKVMLRKSARLMAKNA